MKAIVKFNKTSCIWLTKFRALNNKLPVNVGRCHGESREEPICYKYDVGAVGDEYHVLFACTNGNIVKL